MAGGHSGTSAARLTNTGTSAGYCVLNDHPDWVAQTAPGLYTASLWVRSDTPGATLGLTLADIAHSFQSGAAASSTITLTSAWQQVSVSYSPRFPAGGSLNLWASMYQRMRTACSASNAGITSARIS